MTVEYVISFHRTDSNQIPVHSSLSVFTDYTARRANRMASRKGQKSKYLTSQGKFWSTEKEIKF